MNYPQAIYDLIKAFSELPNVGPKTAERYVFHLLKNPNSQLFNLSKNINELKTRIKNCSRCKTFTDTDICSICQNKNRKSDTLCIVENTQDLFSIESTNEFKGKYFVLGKLINTIEGIMPENLPIKELSDLILKEKTKELIIALNFTMEGETTSLYLKRLFKDIKVSRLARGLPLGSDLEYADSLSLSNALKYRQSL